MTQYVTPLRYPGGKSKLANFMKEVVRLNDLVGGHYVEAYAGGASIAFHLLFDGYVEHVHINDFSKSIFSFWHSVLNDTENLCRLIRDTPVSMAQWRKQKAIQEESDKHSLLELGFSTFFLNRTNRSGILIGSGVIGGLNQDGGWSLNARYNKSGLILRIEKIAQFKDKITLYNRDAADIIQDVVPRLPRKSLIFLDPPYYSKGRRLYKDDYRPEDHVAIAMAVSKMRNKWIVSYDDTPQVHKLYSKFTRMTYWLNYSANEIYKGSEVLFSSDDLVLPQTKDPTKIKISHNNEMSAHLLG